MLPHAPKPRLCSSLRWPVGEHLQAKQTESHMDSRHGAGSMLATKRLGAVQTLRPGAGPITDGALRPAPSRLLLHVRQRPQLYRQCRRICFRSQIPTDEHQCPPIDVMLALATWQSLLHVFGACKATHHETPPMHAQAPPFAAACSPSALAPGLAASACLSR